MKLKVITILPLLFVLILILNVYAESDNYNFSTNELKLSQDISQLKEHYNSIYDGLVNKYMNNASFVIMAIGILITIFGLIIPLYLNFQRNKEYDKFENKILKNQELYEGKIERVISNITKIENDVEKFIKPKIDEIINEQKLKNEVKESIIDKVKVKKDGFGINIKDIDSSKIKECQKFFSDHNETICWIYLAVATDNISKKEFKKSEKILNYLLMLDVDDTTLKTLIYHCLGQVFKEYGDKMREDNNLYNKPKTKILLSESLEYFYKKSADYYYEAYSISSNNDESYGNRAVVLIELAKAQNSNSNENKIYFENAIEMLNKVIELGKADYNTYFDLSRCHYMLSNTAAEDESAAKTHLKYLEEAFQKAKDIDKQGLLLKYIEKENYNKFNENSEIKAIVEKYKNGK